MIESFIGSLNLVMKSIIENVLKEEVPFYFLKFEELVTEPEP